MKILVSLAAIALIAAPVTAKDVKVPTSPKAAVKTAQCKNAKNQFAKCGTPGAVPINAAAVIEDNPAKVTVDKTGRCHVAAGPKKGDFTACPKK